MLKYIFGVFFSLTWTQKWVWLYTCNMYLKYSPEYIQKYISVAGSRGGGGGGGGVSGQVLEKTPFLQL